ncbi:MAG: hypothetical protein ACJA1L_001666 [Paracoccaceae bacterium]|jgi:hypothetical protein
MTHMDGLTNIFDVLGNHWAAKWLVLALAIRTIWTVVAWRICPLMRGRANLDADSAAKAEASGARQRLRFAAVMLLGIAMAVVGLFKMAEVGEGAPLALLGMTLGIYLFTTEPVRRGLALAQNGVMMAATRSAEAQAMSVSILRDTHIKLVAVEFGILMLIGLGMRVA